MCIALYKIKETCEYSFSSSNQNIKIFKYQNIEKSKQFLLLFFIVYLLKPFPCIGEHGLEHNGVLFKKIFKIVPEKNRRKKHLEDERPVLVVLLGVGAELHEVLEGKEMSIS